MLSNYIYKDIILMLSKYNYRDLSLMVKRMTFNHSHKGSSPLDLKKKKTAIG